MSKERVPREVIEVLEHFKPLEQEPDIVEAVREKIPTHLFVDDPDTRHDAWCSHCREWVHIDKSRHKATVACPCCGEKGDVIHTWRGYKRLTDKLLMYVYGKSAKSPADTITARAIYMEYNWYMEDGLIGAPARVLPWNVEPYVVVDSYYVFVYGQGAVQAKPVNNWRMNAKYPCTSIEHWDIRGSVNDRFGRYMGTFGAPQRTAFGIDTASIDYAVAGTPFHYVWDEIGDLFVNAGNRGAYIKLFDRLARYPFAVEALAKLGAPTQQWLYEITERNQSAGGVLNWRGKTIKKLFRYGFTKEEKAWLRHTRSTRISEGSFFAVWQWLRGHGDTQTTLPEIDKYKLTIYAASKIRGVISLPRLVKYLKRQQDKRPGYDITIDLYVDYLNYCERLNMDTSEKATFMPRDLIEAHDTLIREYQQIQELRREEEHRRRTLGEKQKARAENRAYKKLRPKILRKYTFEADGMMIYVPKKLEELIDEGIAMHSCVGTYVERVAAGKTIVVFIRSAEDPGERIGTMEISKDGLSIVQARAKFNRALPPEAEAFVEKFKAAKIEAINHVMEETA